MKTSQANSNSLILNATLIPRLRSLHWITNYSSSGVMEIHLYVINHKLTILECMKRPICCQTECFTVRYYKTVKVDTHMYSNLS